MAQLRNAFDSSQVEPSSPMDPIPAGDYAMIISESEMKATKNGNGEYLQLVCQVIDGEYKGRKVWERLNLYNPNATAVSIAEATLSAICRAVGVVHCQDSEDLHDKPFVGSVKFVPESGQYKAKNEMAGYAPLAGAAPKPAAKPAASASAPKADDSTPPWKKSAA